MASGRRRYFRRTRKIRLRDMKHSKVGIIGMSSSMMAAVLFVGGVIWSFLARGEAEEMLGSVGLVGLVLAAGALLLGVMSIREPKVRLIAPRTSIILGAIMTAVYVSLYAYGWQIL